MALRLRRGIDSERQLITPLEGELIYTTDTKILYIGDGVTPGGLQVTGVFPESIDDLTDVDISSVSPTIGQVPTWNGTEFVPEEPISEGQNYRLNIIAGDSSLMVDTNFKTFSGNAFFSQNFIGGTFSGSFAGDGSQLTDLPINGNSYEINITGEDSQVIVDAATNTFTGSFVGDGSQLTNLPVSTNSSEILEGGTYQLNITGEDSQVIVDAATNTFTGSFVGDGSGLTNLSIPEGGTYQFNITGEDSQVIVDTATNTFIGSFVGDTQGSLTSDDSMILVDAVNGEILAPVRDLSLLGTTNDGSAVSDTTTPVEWLEITVNGNTRYMPLYI